MNNSTALLVGIGIAVGVIVLLRPRGSAFNPASPDNWAYQGANAFGGAIAGERDWSLGAWLWEVTHPRQREAERGVTGNGYGVSGRW